MTHLQKKANKRIFLKQAAAFLAAATSGMAWEPAIRFAQLVMGSDHVLYAMDYPYQFDISEVIASNNLSISDHDEKLLYQRSAERLFSLGD